MRRRVAAAAVFDRPARLHFTLNIPFASIFAAGVVAVSAGGWALHSDGTIVGWGDNSSGQISIPPGATNVIAITHDASRIIPPHHVHTSIPYALILL
jgi:hypothetical protein